MGFSSWEASLPGRWFPFDLPVDSTGSVPTSQPVPQMTLGVTHSPSLSNSASSADHVSVSRLHRRLPPPDPDTLSLHPECSDLDELEDGQVLSDQEV